MSKYITFGLTIDRYEDIKKNKEDLLNQFLRMRKEETHAKKQKEKKKIDEFDDYFTAKYSKDPNFGKVDDLNNLKYRPQYEEARINNAKEGHEKYEFFSGGSVSYFEERMDEFEEGIEHLTEIQKEIYKRPPNSDMKMYSNAIWKIRYFILLFGAIFSFYNLLPEIHFKIDKKKGNQV